MPTHLVQIGDGSARRVALVREPNLICLDGHASIYALAQHCLDHSLVLSTYVESLATGETLSYDEVYAQRSPWHLLPPIDIPDAPSRVLIAGTGLTHLGSARERQAMHLTEAAKVEAAKLKAEEPDTPMTDSMRMFQWGVDGGRPAANQVGIAPEWFYKGDASVLRAPFEALEIPSFAEDGGEEAELAGIYLIAHDGTPHRIGITMGNEFADHHFERRNYLNLAGSKLRVCSLGPELVVAADFNDIQGEVRIEREGTTLWEKKIASGEANMCHSLANLEHHHFKFAGHRQPGSVHIHFFGADALSFGSGIVLQQGDLAEIRFEGFGRALINPIHVEPRTSAPVQIVPFS